jgi:DNA-binding transcriptional ArsR family regulator
MRTVPPPLLPILRSQVQAEMLTALLLRPDREYTLTELSELADTPLSTVRREIDRLSEVGLVSERQVGRSRLVKAAADHVYARPLTELIVHAFGPRLVIAEEFAELPGEPAVAIFGSWAARNAGVPGRTPNDVDVLVVGRVSRSDVYAAAERAESRLYRIPVNPVLSSLDRWYAEADALIREVKVNPVLWVVGDEPPPAEREAEQ